MITIHKPEIVEHDGKVRIQTAIDIDGEKKQIWFEVDPEYAEYLCPERSDAYVIGLLSWAMRHKHDITCEVPMGEELHYQISTYLIPSLAKNSKVLYPTKIVADLADTPVSNAGAIGTGISCGIDSMHVLASQAENGHLYPSLKITHLIHNNVGSHGVGRRAELLHPGVKANAVKFANEIGLKIITTDSNFAESFWEGHWHHLFMQTYSDCFAIYMLQKLWKVYFYASDGGGDFSTFNIVNSEKNGPYKYDLLSLSCFSTQSLTIYSEGGAKTRFEKTKTVVTYPPAKKYLNVCVFSVSNCGECWKCSRTLLALDALNQLDDFQAVFDIDHYKSHRWRYYCRLYGEKLRGNKYLKGIYEILRPKINVLHRLGGVAWFFAFWGFEFFEWFCNKVPFFSKRYNAYVQDLLDRKAEAGGSRE